MLLESPSQVARAAKAWSHSQVLGIDTEFVRERTYHANLGLVQISDGQTVWLVDPLVEGATEPVKTLLEDRDIIKVLHSPSEDLEVLRYAVGAIPEPMVDTQLACALLGEPLQLGYHMAVQQLLGLEVDKGLTRSNWCARPLAPQLLHYAALDVCLLPLMWAMLEERLARLGRLDWLTEDCSRQLENARRLPSPADSWRRIKGNGALDGASIAMLKALAQWREKEARKRNRPRSFIVPDLVLLNIARNKIRDPEDLVDLEDLHPRARQRYGAGLTNIVDNILTSGKTMPVLPQMDHRQRKQLKQLRQATEKIAGKLGVEPALLAARKDLEQLLLEDHEGHLPTRLGGWRKPILTEKLLPLLQ